MKREIKFKAKSIYNGEWVYGDLLHQADGTHIFMGKGGNGHTLCPRVDPSTVCQFTGLKDSNGVEIWEGDYISSIYSYPKQKKVEFKNGAFGIETYYRGLDFLPFACCDIRAGCLIEFELEDRKEGEK